MKLEFDKRYPVPARPEQAWAVLADIRATAACWPGAALTAQQDTRRYQGTVGLQLEGAPLRLDGGIELLGLDVTRREMRLRGQGDAAGRSMMAVDLRLQVDAGDTPGASALVCRASVTVDGELAQHERHLLVTLGDRLLAQFAENFRAAAAAVPAQGGPSARAAGKKATSALSAAGADSTLTLMVQAGQAPGAAFAHQDGSVPGRGADAQRAGESGGHGRGAWAALRRWWSSLFGRGG